MGQPMHAAAAAVEQPGNCNTAPPDDEWEYEYDTTETEDYYFTLDLTTHVPKALGAPTRKSNKDAEIDPALRTGEQAAEPTDAKEPSGEDGVGSHQIQITDLHTEEPLVRFNEGIYNCYWATDLGTQFHISRAGVTSNPRRSGTELDVVGTSQTRLIGKPAELIPREGREGRRRLATLGKNLLNAIHVNDDSDGERDVLPAKKPQPISAHAVAGEPLRISRESCKDPAADAQASFLERLSAIKLKKGERDLVPVISVRNYEPPENADELRKTALAKDAEEAKRQKESEVQARERVKRRRLTNAERGIPDKDASRAGRPSRSALSERIGFQEPSEAPRVASGTSTETSNAHAMSVGGPTPHAQNGHAAASADFDTDTEENSQEAAASLLRVFSAGGPARDTQSDVDPKVSSCPATSTTQTSDVLNPKQDIGASIPQPTGQAEASSIPSGLDATTSGDNATESAQHDGGSRPQAFPDPPENADEDDD